MHKVVLLARENHLSMEEFFAKVEYMATRRSLISLPRLALYILLLGLFSTLIPILNLHALQAFLSLQSLDDQDQDWRITQHVIRAWGEEDGLPINGIRAIAQSNDGYVWIGTELGLSRFDGREFGLELKVKVCIEPVVILSSVMESQMVCLDAV